MRFSPLLALHICAGTLGFLSGALAVSLRKGSRRHGWAGSVFVASMLTLAASGVWLAIAKHQPGNILGGVLTFYLVATSWMTARSRAGAPGVLEWSALLAVLALTSVIVTFGVEAALSPTGLKHGYPPGVYAFLGSVASLSAVGDVRLLIRRGIQGTQRIARHLWRMCFAWFIASASIFLARQQLFPEVMRKTGVLYFLTVLPLLLMIFWLIRVRVARTSWGKATRPAADAYSLRT